jgi:hypothetical protein
VDAGCRFLTVLERLAVERAEAYFGMAFDEYVPVPATQE